MNRVQGKKALVTAAGQGIGRAIVNALAREGAIVCATDVDESKLKGLRDCERRHLDVLDADEIRSVMAATGPLDILCNCAGYVAAGTIIDCSERDWEFSYALNVTAMYRTIREALPAMINRRSGSIINISSVASSVKGVPNRCAYSATKAAVIGLTKSIAVDFVDRGIRCNAICPGTVDTPSLHERLQATGDYEAAWAQFTARQPMRRVGRPEEIAALAVHLATDESAFTTGQVHIIDGGWVS